MWGNRIAKVYLGIAYVARDTAGFSHNSGICLREFCMQRLFLCPFPIDANSVVLVASRAVRAESGPALAAGGDRRSFGA